MPRDREPSAPVGALPAIWQPDRRQVLRAGDESDRLTALQTLRCCGVPAVTQMLGELAAAARGSLIQRRVTSHPQLALLFGAAVRSIGAIVLLTPAGPVITASCTTASNPSGNFWRTKNRLGGLPSRRARQSACARQRRQ
jgi:hypothetical protein